MPKATPGEPSQGPTLRHAKADRRKPSRIIKSDRLMMILLLFWTAFFSIAALRAHKPFALSSLAGHAGQQQSALLLTAHPDDECMFFSPTITSLVSQGWDIKALCVSTGNGDGLGAERAKELYESYSVLGVPRQNVALMDDARFQDGMHNEWNVSEIVSVLEDYVASTPVSLIVTFDQDGITQHPNHIALHHAVELYRTQTLSSRQALYLRSPGVLTKFTGPLFPAAHIFRRNILNPWDSIKRRLRPGGQHPDPTTVVVIGSVWNWISGWKAMLEHETQLVWFRWLYLAFSRLMWMNELVVAV